jgi:DNA repair protein RadA/Sms
MILVLKSWFRLGSQDVFLNITGGISVDDPAIDLAVVAAILSSNEDIPVNRIFALLAKGLSGEIRPLTE